MPLVLEIVPELESQIRQAAAQAGISPDAYIVESVTERLRQTQPRHSTVKRLPKSEANLLQAINQSLSQMAWTQYQALIAKRQAGILTPAEQVELIALSDQKRRMSNGSKRWRN